MGQTKTGAKNAILVVASPPHFSVGIRFVQDETPAPVVVAKARGLAAMRQLAGASDAPEVVDPVLAAEIMRIGVGSYVIEEGAIRRLIPHLQQAMAQRR